MRYQIHHATIDSRPRPKGSRRALLHRSTGKVVTFDSGSKALTAFKRAAMLALTTAPGRPREAITEPVGVRLAFIFERPAVHFRANGELRVTAPVYPSGRFYPDGDKVERAVWDLLTSARWIADDSLVCQWSGEKEFTTYAGTGGSVRVSLWRL